jgi:hypothetical protein
MPTPTEMLATALSTEPISLSAVSDALEEAPAEERVRLLRTIKGREQARLWIAAESGKVPLEHLVPDGVGPATEVIHAGKNSLPVFTCFEKRFCRDKSVEDRLWGYNEGPTRGLVGPGYFIARVDEKTGSACVDYYEIPPEGASLPPTWPAKKPNESGLSMLVYAKMVDHLRQVGPHVVVGRAVKNGKITDNYFLLCRIDPR